MSLNDCLYELCRDTELNRIINSCNENRNRNVIEYILNKCSQECQFESIAESFRVSLKESSKNIDKSHDLMYEACKMLECKDYEQALKLFNDSLQKLPHTHNSFIDDLNKLLTGRAICFEELQRHDELKLNNSISSSIFNILNGHSSIKEFNKKEQHNNTCNNFLSPMLESHLYRNQHSRQFKVGFKSKKIIFKNQILINEKLIAIVRPLESGHCLNCDKTISDAFYPCFLCSHVRYCSLSCAEEGFQFHKFECGLLSAFYEHKLILHLSMLRFYSKVNQSPLTEFNPGYNYLFNFQKNFCGKLPKDIYLNSLRQSLVQTEKPKSVYFRPKLFGNIFRSIVFELIYSFSLHRAEFAILSRKKNRFNLQKFDSKFIEDLKRINKIEMIFENMNRLDLLEKIFDDVNRFDDCAFIETTSFPWANDDSCSQDNKISYIPVLCSGLTSHHSTQHFEVWTLENGYLSVRSNRDIYQGAIVSITNRFHKQKSQKMYEIIENLRKDAMIENQKEIDYKK